MWYIVIYYDFITQLFIWSVIFAIQCFYKVFMASLCFQLINVSISDLSFHAQKHSDMLSMGLLFVHTCLSLKFDD